MSARTTHKLSPGEVAILWRFRHNWRDGSNHDRHWRWYAKANPKEAQSFMAHKAPNDEMFEFKATAKNNC